MSTTSCVSLCDAMRCFDPLRLDSEPALLTDERDDFRQCVVLCKSYLSNVEILPFAGIVWGWG